MKNKTLKQMNLPSSMTGASEIFCVTITAMWDHCCMKCVVLRSYSLKVP